MQGEYVRSLRISDNYGSKLKLVFESEKHTIDWRIEWWVKKYLQFVLYHEDLTEDTGILWKMIDKYGSISRGLEVLKHAARKGKWKATTDADTTGFRYKKAHRCRNTVCLCL